jgi:hypothetical protein
MAAIPTGTWEFYAAQGNFITRMGYDGNNNAAYMGFAQPGSLDTDSSWRIVNTTYTLLAGTYYQSSTGFPQDANGNPSCGFNFQWNLRTTYTYS